MIFNALNFPDTLPIVAKKDEIITAIQKHQVIIIAGETGSGKTTQLPKFCLAAGLGERMIACTQPRRIAARSIATRLANELKTPLGQGVGYQIRFSKTVNKHTKIKVMTDGILLAEIEHDRNLSAYEAIIIDEAHERSLNIDFLLGYLRCLLQKRKDLKLIISSATIDTEKFSQYYKAPVIEVSGRSYPVEVRYHPIDEDKGDNPVSQAVLDAIKECQKLSQGDILVFFATEREIRDTLTFIQKFLEECELLPLYARLSVQEQEKIFKPAKKRRIILASNVAETSLTIPGIHYVIDTGLARISRYSIRNKVNRLPIEKISQSSANQRKGRCGRLANGVCIRLYSAEDFAQRAEFTDPEILRTALASVILKMKTLKLGNIESFEFLSMPNKKAVNEGYQLLLELSALDKERNITPIGRELAALPIDPKLGKMLLSAKKNGLHEMFIICAVLAAQDPRERPQTKQNQADLAHKTWQHARSDFMTYINLWDDIEKQKQALSANQFRKWCRKSYLSYSRIREWQDLYQQLRQAMGKPAIKENNADYNVIHQAILTGLLGNIGLRKEKREYQGVREIRWQIFPASGLAKSPPKWCVCAALIETSRLFAHCVAAVEPEWIEKAASNVIRKDYFEPHWNKAKSTVDAFVKVTLYGLVLIAKKKVNYSSIKPQEAREIFIHHALVENEYLLSEDAKYRTHNQQLITEIATLENKARKVDILVEYTQRFEFYDKKIPKSVNTAKAFEKWRKTAEQHDPKVLCMTKQDIMARDALEVTAEQYPELLLIDNLVIPVNYSFNPGEQGDGATIEVPLSGLKQISQGRLDWLVPGLLLEKITALIKALPKRLRRSFVPVPDFSKACIEAIVPGNPLTEQLSSQLKRMTGVYVEPLEWNFSQLPEHLNFTIKVIDSHNKCVDSSKNLQQLQAKWEHVASQQFHAGSQPDFCRSDIKQWDFGEIPKCYYWQQNGIEMQGYPGLMDAGNSVSLKLYETEIEAKYQMKNGCRRLILLSIGKQIKELNRRSSLSLALIKQYQCHVGNQMTLLEELMFKSIDQILANLDPILSEQHFTAALNQVKTKITREIAQFINLIKNLFDVLALTKKQMLAIKKQHPIVVQQIEAQLKQLIYSGFIYQTPDKWLQEYPRYLKAIQKRIDRLALDYHKDQSKYAKLQPFLAHFNKQSDCHNDDKLWLLEEFRVSLFAQELKTKIPVSEKRLKSVFT